MCRSGARPLPPPPWCDVQVFYIYVYFTGVLYRGYCSCQILGREFHCERGGKGAENKERKSKLSNTIIVTSYCTFLLLHYRN